ncbi:hypothetical protein GCM10009765_15230 [Fodinicola feengrottensis]|uniref:NADH-quinone oxidoreductase n=1 Tax=Fodinicola feengrottensis TaxID=435914 RepID=A0ABN2G7M0_9ACTN
MTGRLTDHLADRFGPDATSVSHGLLVLDVEPKQWIEALTYARDDLGCTYFDWLSAVDELENGLSVRAHLWSRTRRHHLLVRTLLPPGWPVLPTASGIFRGANWHERETHEMFGVRFDGHPYPRPLLLPDGFEGCPLKKSFVLASRVVKQWPGAVDPGQSASEARGRRRPKLPLGVPKPDEWGGSTCGTT